MSVHEWLLRSCNACDDLLEERERGGGLDPHSLVISNLLDSQSKIAENMPVRIPSTRISEKKIISRTPMNPTHPEKISYGSICTFSFLDMKSIRDCYWLLRLTVEFSSNVVFIKKNKQIIYELYIESIWFIIFTRGKWIFALSRKRAVLTGMHMHALLVQ